MNRKLLFVLLLGAFSTGAQANDPVIMKVAGKEIHKSDFEYIYKKNNNTSSIEQKTLDEYVDLYTKLQLKVAEAKAQGIDRSPEFINELSGYRKQLASPYLENKAAIESAVQNAYNRLINQVEASHVLITCNKDAAPVDTLQAYNKAMEVYEKVQKGEKFEDLAVMYSQDPSAIENKGHLGYFRGFMMVRPFEDAAYNTPIGEISLPIRSQFGYHVIKITNNRPDPGRVMASHIMINCPKGSDEATEKEAKKQVDEIYDLLTKGASFEELARTRSTDSYSKEKGGELGTFGMFSFPREFEEAVFGLKEIGQFSKPFRTAFGWHIAKKLDQKPVETLEEKRSEIMQHFAQDDRKNIGRKAFIEQIGKEYQPTVNRQNWNILIKELANSPSDSTFYASATDNILLKIQNKEFKTADFIKFVKEHGNASRFKSKIKSTEKEFLDYALLAYEDTQLEAKHPEFRHLMNEYFDGMLFFEISNKEVWEKAANDEKGLKSYFAKNKKKYAWTEPRTKGYLLYCLNDSTLSAAKKLLKIAPSDSATVIIPRQLNDSITRIRIIKGLFTQADIDKFKEGDGKYKQMNTRELYIEKVLPTMPEDYRDVKGLVISDYQNFVETKWLTSLRKKHKVELNKEILNTIK